MPRLSMVEAIRDAMDCKMAEDETRRRVRRGRRLFRRRLPLHRGPAAQIRQVALLRRADQQIGHRRRRHRHGRLRPEAGRGDPVRRLCLSGLRPDRVGGGAAALPLGRRVLRPDRHPHAVRRRHLRRADAQPEPGGAVHPRLRPQDRHPVEPLRRQGPPDRLDRGRRSGDLPRAEAALQRPVLRPSRPAGDAVGEASLERGAGRAATSCRSARRRCGARARA